MDVDAQFDGIVEDLGPRGVSSGALFGARSLTFDGTAFACLKGGRLAVRLDAGSAMHAEALALPDAELFDPSGKGRPFKDWVAIASAQSEHWLRYAEAGLETVTA
jgi:TfoX/Sxy family transcriptional regulator of competence genes